MQRFVEGVGGMAGVFDFQHHVESSRLGGASAQKAFGAKRDSVGKIAAGYAPDIGRNTAAGMKKVMEFDSHFDCGQRLVRHREGRRLRGEQRGETNQERKLSNDLSEIHFASFDFTLSTA